MSKKEKLLERFLSIPIDFTWEELLKILSALGYDEIAIGKTSGSRRRFADGEGNIILLHKPHPSNIVKRYAIRQLIENLKQKGKIPNE